MRGALTLRPKGPMATSARLHGSISAALPSHHSLTRRPGKGSAPSLSPSHRPSSFEASLQGAAGPKYNFPRMT